MTLNDVRAGDRLTILNRNGQEWKAKTGRAVMRGAIPGSWVLNLGGRFGTPGVATEENFVKAVR